MTEATCTAAGVVLKRVDVRNVARIVADIGGVTKGDKSIKIRREPEGAEKREGQKAWGIRVTEQKRHLRIFPRGHAWQLRERPSVLPAERKSQMDMFIVSCVVVDHILSILGMGRFENGIEGACFGILDETRGQR